LSCDKPFVTNHIPQTLVTINVIDFAKWTSVASVTMLIRKNNLFRSRGSIDLRTNHILLRIKHLIGIYGFETLFFAPHAFIRIRDSTCSLGKDGISISVSFLVQKLMVRHVS
jgi:hypothetical protein